MGMLNQKIKDDLANAFKNLKQGVTLKFFTQDVECRFCKETRELLEELQAATDKVTIEAHDFVRDAVLAGELGVSRIPAIAVTGDRDYGIRFYGIPSGYEFASLVEAIRLVASGEMKLAPETRSFLDGLSGDVHLQVFVTPTCPYCPPAVILAQQMAFYSPRVRADMIEATEFPQLAQKYNVYGVPRTVINEKESIEGSVPESQLVDKIRQSLVK
ncbi:MAG TPA: thioredoxin family protein [Acidobacteriota bacterium]